MGNVRGKGASEIKSGNVKSSHVTAIGVAGDARPGAMSSGVIPGSQRRLRVGGDGRFYGE